MAVGDRRVLYGPLCLPVMVSDSDTADAAAVPSTIVRKPKCRGGRHACHGNIDCIFHIVSAIPLIKQ